MNAPLLPRFRSREPDSFPDGAHAKPSRDSHPVDRVELSGAVKQYKVASIIGLGRVTKQRHLSSIRRNPQIAHPAFAFEQHLAYRILQSPLIVVRSITASSFPSGPQSASTTFPRTREGRCLPEENGQSASPFIVGKIFWMRQDCHLTLPRDGEEHGPAQTCRR